MARFDFRWVVRIRLDYVGSIRFCLGGVYSNIVGGLQWVGLSSQLIIPGEGRKEGGHKENIDI